MVVVKDLLPEVSGILDRERQTHTLHNSSWAPNIPVISGASAVEGAKLLAIFLSSLELEDSFTGKITRRGKRVDKAVSDKITAFPTEVSFTINKSRRTGRS